MEDKEFKQYQKEIVRAITTTIRKYNYRNSIFEEISNARKKASIKKSDENSQNKSTNSKFNICFDPPYCIVKVKKDKKTMKRSHY